MGRVFAEEEVESTVATTLDFGLPLGPEENVLEREFAGGFGAKHSLLVNSGPSTRLVGFASRATHKLPMHPRILRGDEVATVTTGFPVTVAPVIRQGAIPGFVDNDPDTDNLCADRLRASCASGKTKAVMIANALDELDSNRLK